MNPMLICQTSMRILRENEGKTYFLNTIILFLSSGLSEIYQTLLLAIVSTVSVFAVIAPVPFSLKNPDWSGHTLTC